jgi:hypothetical protein
LSFEPFNAQNGTPEQMFRDPDSSFDGELSFALELASGK